MHFSLIFVVLSKSLIMLQNINKLSERVLKATIGLNKENFNQLTVEFSECEQKIKNKKYEEFVAFYHRKPSAGGSPIFKTPSERLFSTLFYLKTYPTFDVMGFTFGCSGKTAHENLYKNLSILEIVLRKLQVLPKRKFDSVEEFVAYTKEQEDVIFDATERIHHRKKNKKNKKNITMASKKIIP